MSLSVQAHDSARSFLDCAESWLMQAEAEHSLVLGIAGRQAAAPARAPAFFATVHLGGEVEGVVVRTPPHKLLLSRMPLDAVPLVADAAERFERIPAVLGPSDIATAFGAEWARRRPVTPRLGMRQGIFELTTLVPPTRPASGAARLANTDDLGLVTDWMAGFNADVGVVGEDAGKWAEHHIAADAVRLWEDGEPVAMAADVRRSPTGACVGAVYTPPALRGRGYATAIVADLTRRLLDSGLAFCSLYTDLSNPTSNAIYQRLGYTPVADVVDVEFVAL